MRREAEAQTQWTDNRFVDLVERHTELDNMTQILVSIEHPIVIGLNSAWGTGKTTFTHLWRNQLKQKEVTTVYFNAWSAELLADPLVALTTEIAQRVGDEGGLDEGSLKILKGATKFAEKIASRGIPALLKKLSGDAIDLDEETQEAISEVIGRSTEDIINDYKSGRSDSSRLGQLLSKVIEARQSSTPVVVFVDELDRCRPSHAITVLERIKHVFDLHGLHFVVSLDGLQLVHSIRAIYGEGFDAATYLRRFFDLEYTLATPPLDSFIEALWPVYGLPIDEGGPDSEHSTTHCARKVLAQLGPSLGASVRDLEQVLGQLRIAHELTREHADPTIILQALLLLLGAQRRSLLDSVVQADDPSTELVAAVRRITCEISEVQCASVAVAAAIALSGDVEAIAHQAALFDEQASINTADAESASSLHQLAEMTFRFSQSIGHPGALFDPEAILSSVRFATRTR